MGIYSELTIQESYLIEVFVLLQQLANGLALGSVYALFALGFTLIFGVLEIISLAHGAVFMVGAFAGLTVAAKFNLGILPAIAAGMIASGILGLAIDFFAIRPLRKKKHHHLAPMIATIGCATIITSVYQGVFGAEVYRFPFDFVPSTIFTVGSVQLALLQVVIIGTSFAMMVVMALVTTLATTAAADVTGVLLAGLVAAVGLFIIPARRRQGKAKLNEKIAALRGQLSGSLRAQFEKEIRHSLERIQEAIAPYTRFVRAEREKMEEMGKRLKDLKIGIERLRKKIETIR